MRLQLCSCLVGTALLVGCSGDATGVSSIPDVPAAPERPADPMVTAVLDDVNKKLEAQQYDAAVGSLMSLQGLPKTSAQEDAFVAQMRKTADALAAKEAAGDQGASASRQMLGRVMTGR